MVGDRSGFEITNYGISGWLSYTAVLGKNRKRFSDVLAVLAGARFMIPRDSRYLPGTNLSNSIPYCTSAIQVGQITLRIERHPSPCEFTNLSVDPGTFHSSLPRSRSECVE
jgi:hypothetical protein